MNISFTYPAMAELHEEYDHEVTLHNLEYVQFTYETLHVYPPGEDVAVIDSDGFWKFRADVVDKYVTPGKVNEFSDLIVWED